MDDSRFEELYEKTARPLWSYISRIAGSATLADDLLQETFFRFLRAPIKETADADGDGAAVKSYLFKIATNLVYDHFRRVQRENRWQLLSAGQTEERDPTYDTFTEGSEMMQVFHNLKTQERALLWLAYVEGYEHREIAAVLNLNAMSVRVLLFRARRKLAGLLEGEKKGN